MDRLAILMVLAAGAALAADVCPPGGARLQGAQPRVLAWESSANFLAKDHICLTNSVRNVSNSPLEVRWEEGGIERAWVSNWPATNRTAHVGLGYLSGSRQYQLYLLVPGNHA